MTIRSDPPDPSLSERVVSALPGQERARHLLYSLTDWFKETRVSFGVEQFFIAFVFRWNVLVSAPFPLLAPLRMSFLCFRSPKRTRCIVHLVTARANIYRSFSLWLWSWSQAKRNSRKGADLLFHSSEPCL